MEICRFLFTIFVIILMLLRSAFQLEIGDVNNIISQSQPLKYSKDELRSLRPNVVCKPDVDLPKELKPRKRGRKGGVKNRLKRRGQRVCLPSVGVKLNKIGHFWLHFSCSSKK